MALSTGTEKRMDIHSSISHKYLQGYKNICMDVSFDTFSNTYVINYSSKSVPSRGITKQYYSYQIIKDCLPFISVFEQL